MQKQLWRKVGLSLVLGSLGSVVGIYSHPQAAVQNSANPFESTKVLLNAENLVAQGVQIHPLALAAKTSDVSLPRGLKLAALVDNRCLRATQARGEFSGHSEIIEPELDHQVISLELNSPRTVRELNQAADADQCLEGLTEDLEFHLAGEFTTDPLANSQTHLGALHLEEANELFWGSSAAITSDVIIAIVDSGVNYRHPDLVNQMWKDLNNHFGKDFVNNTDTPMDDNGHGSHVAGLAAAQANNGVGGLGVMGFHAKIMAVKSMDATGSGSVPSVVNGIRYAIAQKANVINLSLAASGSSPLLLQALQEAVSAGIFVAGAAGNDGLAISNTQVFSPASYGAGLDGFVTVGSIGTNNLQRSDFSNFSSTFVEIGAPGSAGSSGLISTYLGSEYAEMEGTSMAAPLVAGSGALVIGWLRSRGLTWTPAQIESILKISSAKESTLKTSFVDGNRLDLARVSEYLKNSYYVDGSSGLRSE